MAIKTIVMLGLFFGSHAIIVSGIVGTSWLFWSLWLVMGIGLAGIGMCICMMVIMGRIQRIN